MLATIVTKTFLDRWKGVAIGSAVLAVMFFFGMAVYRDIDLAVIYALGFPAFRGGLLAWGDSLGAAEILRRLERLADHFRVVKPKGSCYLMARSLIPGLDSMTLALRLLNEAKVITSPGVAFGPTGENHIRISFGGTEAEINEAFDRIEGWIGTHYP